MFRQILTIAGNTFVESIRQPVYAVLVTAGLFMMVLAPAISTYTFENDNAMLINMGLSNILVIGVLLAAFTATGVISVEIENKTVLTTVSKPVSRPIFVLGKFVGVTGAITMAFWILMLILLLAVRHRVMSTARDDFDGPVLTFGFFAVFVSLLVASVGNYYYQWVFRSTFVSLLAVALSIAWLLVLLIDRHWHFQPITTEFTLTDSFMPQLHVALLLVFETLLVLSAVAIAASTRLGQIMTLLICFGFFLIGEVGSPILEEQDTVSELLGASGYRTALFTDCYHQFKPSKNFHRGFDEWSWIRGQETDRFRSGPALPPDTMARHVPDHFPDVHRRTEFFRQYLTNNLFRRDEADYYPARLFREAGDLIPEGQAARVALGQLLDTMGDRRGAAVVLDEITIGWKLCLGGSHLRYGFDPEGFLESMSEKPYSFVWFDVSSTQGRLMNPLEVKEGSRAEPKLRQA